MAGCRRLILHWNDAETSSIRVHSAQLRQPSPFLHAPNWNNQIEELGKDGRIILKCNLKYNGRAWAGMFWHKLGITSGILSTWRWEEDGLTISKLFDQVSYLLFIKNAPYIYVHRITRPLARSKPCHITNYLQPPSLKLVTAAYKAVITEIRHRGLHLCRFHRGQWGPIEISRINYHNNAFP
jgi:hypothetical protein